jgi:hypothetical protein
MEIVKFMYNDQEVEFLPAGNENVMVNATQMAKVFGKEVFDFMKNESTKCFISSALKTENSRFISVEKESDLIDSRQKSGTYMHRILALKFAAWLDPDFEFWVFYTIDKLINQHYHEQRQAITEKLTARQMRELKKQELLEKYPEFQEYFDLERKEKIAIGKAHKAIKDQHKQLLLHL